MTFDPVKGHMSYAGWVIDHCDQVSLKSIKATRRYIRLYGWQKKKKKKERKNHRKTEYRRIACACIRKKERKKRVRYSTLRLRRQGNFSSTGSTDPIVHYGWISLEGRDDIQAIIPLFKHRRGYILQPPSINLHTWFSKQMPSVPEDVRAEAF